MIPQCWPQKKPTDCQKHCVPFTQSLTETAGPLGACTVLHAPQCFLYIFYRHRQDIVVRRGPLQNLHCTVLLDQWLPSRLLCCSCASFLLLLVGAFARQAKRRFSALLHCALWASPSLTKGDLRALRETITGGTKRSFQKDPLNGLKRRLQGDLKGSFKGKLYGLQGALEQ